MKLEYVTLRLNLGGRAGLEVEKTVPSWEANVLLAIHGEQNVVEQSRSIQNGDFDPKVEWENLTRKYDSATNEEGKKIVRLVYPDARALGRYFDRNQPEPKRKESLAEIHG